MRRDRAKRTLLSDLPALGGDPTADVGDQNRLAALAIDDHRVDDALAEPLDCEGPRAMVSANDRT